MSPPYVFRLLCAALGLLGVSGAQGAEMSEDLAELVLPTNTVEVGAYHYSSPYGAYGRYFAYGKADTGPLFGVDWRGGGAYQGADAQHWRVVLENPGLNTRHLGLEYADQGRFQLNLDCLSLPFLLSGAYQTPLQGAGSDRLTLPAGFGARTAAGPSALPALAGQFQEYALGTQRDRTDLSFSQELSEAWQFKASLRHELKWGSRDRAALSGGTGGTVVVLPEKVQASTDQFTLALAYAEQGRHLQLGYYGSLFRNQVEGISYQNPFSSGQLENRLSVAPDNQFHQWKLEGGTSLGTTTRLSGAMAYGRVTQNDSFLPYSTSPTAVALPTASLNGLVVTESANLRLSSRPWRSLSLRAGWQYDSRDNRTPVHAYTRSNYEAGSNGTSSNIPYSRNRSKAYVEADYTLARGSQIGLGLEEARIHRYCRSTASVCSEVETSKEQTWRGEWRQQLGEQVTVRLSHAESRRQADAYSPVQGVAELAGMAKFFLADRERSQWRATTTWQATDALSFNFRLDQNQDHYNQSRYGLRDAASHTYNLEAALALNDDLSLYTYYNRDFIRSRLDGSYSSPAISPSGTTQWTLRMNDVADAVGLGLRHMGLLSGLLELSADLAWMEVRSNYDVAGGGCTSSTCNGNIPSALPQVSSRLLSFNAQGRYQLDQQSALRAFLTVHHRQARDYAYEGIGATSSTRLLGTLESPVGLEGIYLGLSYLRSFR